MCIYIYIYTHLSICERRERRERFAAQGGKRSAGGAGGQGAAGAGNVRAGFQIASSVVLSRSCCLRYSQQPWQLDVDGGFDIVSEDGEGGSSGPSGIIFEIMQ